MSDINLGRRAAVRISFEGVNITESIQPYLLSFEYTDSEEDEADNLKIVLQDRDGIWMEKWLNDAVNASSGAGGTGLNIKAVILRQNWNGDGKDEELDCGDFELDTVKCEGPPAKVTIKATSLPYNAQIRQTTKNKGWEKYNLSGIAAEMAGQCGMECMFLAANDPFYDRVEQYQMSDIALLRRLSHDAGISLKVTSKKLVLFDQVDYESKPPVMEIQKAPGAYSGGVSEKAYISYRLSIGTADTQYQSCRVSYNDPGTGKCIEGIYESPDGGGSGDGQRLEIHAKVSSAAQAKQLAEKNLRLHNKYCRTAEFTLSGNPALVAGQTVNLTDWGSWSGKHIIKQATHTIGGSGYTTEISVRKALEGY